MEKLIHSYAPVSLILLTPVLTLCPDPGVICVCTQVVPAILAVDHAENATVRNEVGSAMANEGTMKGSSSTSFFKVQQDQTNMDGRWEEHRSLLGNGATQVTGTTGARLGAKTSWIRGTLGASREVAGAHTAAAGVVSEEFLRNYFTDVRLILLFSR